MQYEYDQAVAQLSEGRKGLEQYRALVERVTYQVNNEQRHVTDLESKVKAYLQAGDRETAAKFALELQKAKNELAENQAQLKMHEEAYNNNVTKIKHATGKLSKIREKIAKYDAELKMSKAEAEVAKLAAELQLRRHDRFRPDRAGDSGQDRPQPGQGPRRRRPVRRRDRRYPARAGGGKGAGRPGA